MDHLTKKSQKIKFKGFTIIEVLIVVAILGILAAIAIPQVTKYTTNARRADGKTALLAAAQAMERYYTNNYTYVDATIGVDKNATVKKLSQSGYYDLCFTDDNLTECKLSNSESFKFIIKTVPNANKKQAGDSLCAKLTIDHLGVKGARDNQGNDQTEACWR
ncbi:type IV pilin protein [Desulfonatronum thiodismutans]|uniref:type IV pilin protein n=1 Tax=Desulfonatronum thiodismutans TaxID=159290 RepID=UPI00068DFEE1|nr:type IV pilin protein [Desulfonatronum thiodismutans]